MLIHPDFKKELQLTTDASNYAIGALLSQEDRPIMCISRTPSKAEEHYAKFFKQHIQLYLIPNSHTLMRYLSRI